ncbi:MAG: FAD-dependent monooxygenase [Terracidiphilus sp.]
MTALPHPVDHLVIGGGLAGSMVAIRLAAAGRGVVLLEKERSSHHKVCGEFLSTEAVDYLRSAGVNPLDLGAAPIHSVRLSSRQTVVEAPLPFAALSLSRSVLDAAMLARAAQSGCIVRLGAPVESLEKRGDLWRVQLRNGESLSARTVFLANGKHDLRGWERGPGIQGDLVGFKLHWRLQPHQTEALREHIELFLFPGGYGGLSLVESDLANLCLVVHRASLRSLGGWTELLAAILADNQHLRLRLHGANPLWDRPLAISAIPYGYLANGASSLWRVGDQAAAIPSFTGDGMSIALHSGVLAAQMFLAGATADQFHQKLHTQLSRAMILATLLSRAMVTGPGRTLAPLCLSLFPHAMRWIAASTRISSQHLLAKSA